MGEYYFVVKKKGSSKEYNYSTEEFEEFVKERCDEKVKKLPWYAKFFAKKALDNFGEGLSAALDFMYKKVDEQPAKKKISTTKTTKTKSSPSKKTSSKSKKLSKKSSKKKK